MARVHLQRLSRRTLLLTGAGAFAAALAGLPFRQRCVHAGGVDTPLRIAAIGVGNRGADNLIQLDGEHVTALCDVDDRYLQAAAQRFPKAQLYQDYRELLEHEQLDAVLISTPDHSHAGPALNAMRRGLHVYCEKPLAHNLHETVLLCQTARMQAVITQMGNQHRASAGYRRAQQLLKAGILGRVLSIHAWTLRPYWPQGVNRPETAEPIPSYLNWDLWLGPAAQRPYNSVYHPLGWRGWWDFGTGPLGDLGTHLLDPVLGALQLNEPRFIKAESSEVNDESLPSWSIIRFMWPATKDVLDPIELTWYDGGMQPPREVTNADRLPDDGVLVIGERGKMYIPPLGKAPRLVPSSLIDEGPAAEETVEPVEHIQQWIKACKQQQPDLCDTPFDAGARLTNVCLLGNLAVRVAKEVEWDAEQAMPVNRPECGPWLTRQYRAGWRIE